MAPADRMISLPRRALRYALCIRPLESWNTTPRATGRLPGAKRSNRHSAPCKFSGREHSARVLTSDIEQDLGDSGPEQHVEPVGARVPQQVRGRVPAPVGVEDGPADLGPVEVVESEAVVRRDPGLEQPGLQRGLPGAQLRVERHHVLHPPVRRPGGLQVPAGAPHVVVAGPRVEAGVDAAAAAQHPRARVDDAVLGHEALHGGARGGVGQRVREAGHVLDALVAVGRAAALQQEHAEALRQRGRQRAPGRAAAHDDVVVVGHVRRLRRVLHERVVHAPYCIIFRHVSAHPCQHSI
jgi:hypothetical protein